MAFGDADLDMMLGDVFSVAVVYGATTGRGILNRSDAMVDLSGGTEFAVRTTAVDVQTGDFASLQQDTSITVDGTAYQIRDVAVLDDGKITRLTLAE